MGDIIAFPPPAPSYPAAVKAKGKGPTKRREFGPSRHARTYLDVFRGDKYAGMVSIEGPRVLAWSEDWSTILDQPDVASAVDAIQSGKVRNEAR